MMVMVSPYFFFNISVTFSYDEYGISEVLQKTIITIKKTTNNYGRSNDE